MKPAFEIVDDQIDAYVRGDAKEFAALYEDNATCSFLPSGKVIATGRDEIEEKWAAVFARGPIDFELGGRLEFGRYVLDLERVRIGGAQTREAVAIYHVGDRLIRQVWFLEDIG